MLNILFSGTTKHSITLSAQDGQEPLLKDLCEALTEATGVPAPSQKIIFKGNTVYVLFNVFGFHVLTSHLCLGYKLQ